MYIIAIAGYVEEGAYGVMDDCGETALYFFEDEDDAIRYAGLLEADDSPEMQVVEVEDEIAIETCENYNYHYVIVTSDEFVIPPKHNVEYSENKI
jgi:hypothetical protein